ncbi:hypothetical protein E2562_001344 [Oryza meyeriana var. granulata]|uniref:Uncharacterized protein n=1 Tax=Oryza meyeriana var. granulata TaxID=110450 RepID=A0A6G1DCB9_9ORYZ|nr:hypothetical protein E2562_001344 [Oryza meyeriana var. granulata]
MLYEGEVRVTATKVGDHGVREKRLTHSELGHLSKADVPMLHHLKEFRLKFVDRYNPFQPLDFAKSSRRAIPWTSLA